VVLDEVFWDALRQHPVPLRDAALRKLGNRSVSLDLYVWLAYRLHTLARPTPVGWAALRAQFGTGHREPHTFRRDFRKAIVAVPRPSADLCTNAPPSYSGPAPDATGRIRAPMRRRPRRGTPGRWPGTACDSPAAAPSSPSPDGAVWAAGDFYRFSAMNVRANPSYSPRPLVNPCRRSLLKALAARCAGQPPQFADAP
jgi:Plasmid encoded RepA protein